MIGRIHSIESCGTVDGPGLRCVVFFQGCALRCRYCHNPDTWNLKAGCQLDSEEILRRIARFRPYFGDSGGVTLSGGEPLLQPEFAASILRGCRELGIHTAVDTSGCVDIHALEQVVPHTDLLLLDIKALSEKQYQWLTGQAMDKFNRALEYIKQSDIDLWLRYVVLPGISDRPEQIAQLKNLLTELGSQVKNVELLPYHNLGAHKWDKLGLKYPLGHLEPAQESAVNQIKSELSQDLKLVAK